MENLRGIALMVASMAGFAFEDAMIKSAASTLAAGQIILILSAIGAVIFALWVRLAGQPLFGPALFERAVVIRNVTEMLSAVFLVSAFTRAPLTTVSAILQAAPLFVTLGAALFLGASVGWRRWSAIAVGFLGVLVILRPGAEGFQPASLLAVAGVVFLAARDLATRGAPAHVSSLVMAFYGFVSASFSGAVLMAFQGGWAPVAPELLLRLAVTAVVGVISYYMIVQAMRTGDVAVVTPFRYSRIVFAMGFGIFMFGEDVDRWTYLGIAIVIGSGLYTLLREARLRRLAR
ncbi:MAG TPA: DMT family transporter [Albidovulum sp.]|uniref:DMT family transporter n=1 Tax=Albidovulum sp. TaxID=1872424 RepID=UPI002D0BDB12|nr:DMT family transporter [Albidovulum sp.]